MNFTIQTNSRDEYLFIEFKGNILTRDDLHAQAQLVFDAILSHEHWKVMVYEPETELPEDLISYFNLVKDYEKQNLDIVRSFKLAVVVAEKYKEAVLSWEAVCQSIGLQFYVFDSFEQAENFLLGKE